jgi:BirA family transcriptional regulator, biotin operon repressor / biotin---[acetyl-CoA-carboxylase] ligase
MEIERHHFASIDSTHTWAKKNILDFSQNKLTVITADEQTAGRGRFNRHWISPPKQNAYISLVFFLDKLKPNLGNIPQVLALSTIKTLEKLGFAPRLKWPNDLLLHHKKVAGILTETSSFGEKMGMVVSVGINVNMPLEWLEVIDRPATSLLIEGGSPLDVQKIVDMLVQQFMEDLEIFYQKGYSYFLNAYKNKLALVKGEKVRFHDHLQRWEGDFHAINEDGSLCLKMPDGQLKTFIAGEIQ